jgi:hypothetical protein
MLAMPSARRRSFWIGATASFSRSTPKIHAFGHHDRPQRPPFRGLDQLRDCIRDALGLWRILRIVSIVGVLLDLIRDRRNTAIGFQHVLVGGFGAGWKKVARERAWLDDDRIDAEARKPVAVGFREGFEGELAGGIDTEEREDHPTHERRDMDEDAAAGSPHVRQNGTIGANGAEEVHGELRFDVLDRIGFRDADGHHSRVVDQGIDPAVLPDDIRDRGVDGSFVGDVHLEDLERTPCSLCGFDKLVANTAISSCDIAHGSNHRVTRLASSTAVSFPKPLLAPVTTATFPLISRSFSRIQRTTEPIDRPVCHCNP